MADCQPGEMFVLLKCGATDFITPPFKSVDILPRIWRLLEEKSAQTAQKNRRAFWQFMRKYRIDPQIYKSHPGLVHIFSALEPSPSYEPWHDKKTHRTYLGPGTGKCLHYYFYFIHEVLGLCYVRVPV